MPSDSGDRQLPLKPLNSGNPTSGHDSIPCPRCDSTDTKFCYYNNYNLSQPRHFCKSCRRYWTQGGTLRNIPVGGGTRKNAKRSRTSPSTTTSSCSSVSYPHHQNQETPYHHSDYHNTSIPGKPISYCSSDSIAVKSDTPLAPLRCDFNLNNVNINVSVCGDGDGGGGDFTSLLNSPTTQTTQESNGGGCPSPPQQQQPPPPQTGSGFLALGGFGLGPGSGFEDIGFDYGSKGFWAPLEGIATEVAAAGGGGGGGGGATWLIGSGGGGNVGGGGGAGDVVDGGYGDGGDHPYFAWPDLAISTTRKGLK